MSNDRLKEMYPKVRIIRPEEFAKVQEAAKADNHGVFYPTHQVIKNGEIIGAFSAGVVVHWWMDSKKAKIRDSIFAMGVLEALLNQVGINDFKIMISDDSPYMQVMEDIGFTKGDNVNLFRKRG